MKEGTKFLILVIFAAINLGFVYWISTYCNINYFIAAVGFAGVVWAIDWGKRKHNMKILKAQREEQEKRAKAFKQQQAIKEQKRQKAIKQQRMREHYNYKKR